MLSGGMPLRVAFSSVIIILILMKTTTMVTAVVGGCKNDTKGCHFAGDDSGDAVYRILFIISRIFAFAGGRAIIILKIFINKRKSVELWPTEKLCVMSSFHMYSNNIQE